MKTVRIRITTSVIAAFVISMIGVSMVAGASALADPLREGLSAYRRGDYVHAAIRLAPLADQGNAEAQALLGFMYDNGLGVPQGYIAAVDFYTRAAEQGNATAQYRLGLMYDKGHGVPQDYVLAYKWLNLAAANASKREREYYLRLRYAVASKMSQAQVAQGQWLALNWVPKRLW